MRKLVPAAVGAALIAAAIATPWSSGSSHREAPNVMLDPTADNTDTYAFVANDAPNALTIVGDWIPGQTPSQGPLFFRFDDRARYYENIDNDGDGLYDIRYRFEFKTKLIRPDSNPYALPPVKSITDPNLNVQQTYSVTRETYKAGKKTGETLLKAGIPTAPAVPGPKTFTQAAAEGAGASVDLGGGRKVFAGQRDDPFFIDLGATFDSINIRNGNSTGNAGGGKNDFAGQDTFAIVLQLPKSDVTRDGKDVTDAKAANATVGITASTERRKIEVTNERFDGFGASRGSWVQVSRLGNPLVNELIVPIGRKDEYNRNQPSQDLKRFGSYVLKPELASILNQLFNVGAPETDRTDIVQALLTGLPGVTQVQAGANPLPTDTLKINLGVPPAETPNRFGVLAGDMQGFPNGRRLGDDVVDIELQVIAGFLKGNKVPLGDGVDKNDKPFLPTFPYLAPPTSGFDQIQSTPNEPTHAPTPAGGA